MLLKIVHPTSITIRSVSIAVFAFLVTNVAVANKFNTAETGDQSGYGTGECCDFSFEGILYALLFLGIIYFVFKD
jgi:hypothetical protein